MTEIDPMGRLFGFDSPNPSKSNEDREGDTPNTTPDAANPSVTRKTRNENINTVTDPLSNPNFEQGRDWRSTDQNPGLDDFSLARPEAAHNSSSYRGTHEKKEPKRFKRLAVITALAAVGLIGAGVAVGVSAAPNSSQEETTSPVVSEYSAEPSASESEVLVPIESDDPSDKLRVLEELQSQREGLELFTDKTAKSEEVLNEILIKPLDLAMTLGYDSEYANDSEKIEAELDRIFEATGLDPFWKDWIHEQWAEDQANGYLGEGNFIRRVAANPDDFYASDLFDTRFAEGVPMRSFLQELPEGGVPDSYNGESRTVGPVTVVALAKINMIQTSDDDHHWKINGYGAPYGSEVEDLTNIYYVDPLENPSTTDLLSDPQY